FLEYKLGSYHATRQFRVDMDVVATRLASLLETNKQKSGKKRKFSKQDWAKPTNYEFDEKRQTYTEKTINKKQSYQTSNLEVAG
ncbi:MAG TPA: hypothetical protein VMB52_04760, partial [Verrucomicrobiae bacterium]|nr:hypothetical protein [Verrucomicrobiae bacterium]